jgi:hypothetical protein
MPKFDREILADIFPPRYVLAFEKLNEAVDNALPQNIDESNSLAVQANTAAQQALARLDEVTARITALELLPPLIPQSPVDDLAPVATSYSAGDDLAPVRFYP